MRKTWWTLRMLKKKTTFCQPWCSWCPKTSRWVESGWNVECCKTHSHDMARRNDRFPTSCTDSNSYWMFARKSWSCIGFGAISGACFKAASYKLPAMSSHGEKELPADRFELLQVDVRNLNGEGFLIRIPASNTGKDLQQMIALQIPQKPGSHISLQHESKKLSLRKSLKEQGFHGEVALSYVYTQLDLPGLEIPCGIPFLEFKENLWMTKKLCWKELPRLKKLQSLNFDNLEKVTLPGSLQALTFGNGFNQSLDNVTLPGSLQSLTFGTDFNQSLENVTLPGSLQSLTFGANFNQSLENVTLPGSLQSLTFGANFNQSLENVTLPGSLQSLTFGDRFNQSLENVTLPGSLQSLTFGYDFNQSLENVTLPGSLQSLTFGDRFNQSLENVTLPGSLQSLTFGYFFQPEPGERHFARQFAKLDFWLLFQPEPGERHFARQFAKLDFWLVSTRAWRTSLCPAVCKAWLLVMVSTRAWRTSLCPAVCKAWLLAEFQPEPGERHFARQFAKLDFWLSDFNQSLENVTLPGSLQSLTFGILISTRAWRTSLCPAVCKAWLLAMVSTRAWRTSLCPAVCKAWLLVQWFQPEPGERHFARQFAKLWLLVIVSTRAWRTSLCPAVCKAWLLVMISTRAWRTSLCPAVCKAWLLANFNQSLENVTLPGSLQSLTFGASFQPEPGERHFARQFAKLDFWLWFQPEPGERHFARQFAKLDFWWSFQPEPGERHFARQFAKLDFWRWFGIWPECSKHDLPSDFWARWLSSFSQIDSKDTS